MNHGLPAARGRLPGRQHCSEKKCCCSLPPGTQWGVGNTETLQTLSNWLAKKGRLLPNYEFEIHAVCPTFLFGKSLRACVKRQRSLNGIRTPRQLFPRGYWLVFPLHTLWGQSPRE